MKRIVGNDSLTSQEAKCRNRNCGTKARYLPSAIKSRVWKTYPRGTPDLAKYIDCPTCGGEIIIRLELGQ